MFLLFPGSVFAVAVNPLSTVAVSGGEDDRGYVWKLSNQELLFECTGTAHEYCICRCGLCVSCT